MERRYDLIIIDAGPTGMSAAIHGSGTDLKTAILEMGAPGGELTETAKISNWPGIIETNGARLASDILEHSTSFNTEYLYGNVIRVKDGAYKRIVCEGGTEYEAKAAIVATGTQERTVNMPRELENVGRGVSYYAVYDGVFFRNQEVVVIGGGDSTLEEANCLTQFANRVNIIIRRDVFRTDSTVQNAIKDNPKITAVTKHTPVRIVDSGMCVTGLVIRNVDTNAETEVKTHGIFPHVGLDLATSFLEGPGILDERGYMIADENCETGAKGIHGVGGVIAKKLRQVATTTNDGAITAQHASHGIKRT